MSKIDSHSSKNILYLDIGNSSIKGAFKKGLKWELIHSERPLTALDLVNWINEHPEAFSEIVVSSVRADVREAIHEQFYDMRLTELSIKDIPRELLDYETIDTLGIDRFLACYGATEQTTNSVVVIDAGTAITIDFMDQDDVYHGGIIAPGLAAFAEILHEKAPALPNVEMDVPKIWPGKSTVNSLKWGQAGFYKMALEGFLDKYETEFGSFELFVTGGDSRLVEAMISCESKVRPLLVFEGMERLKKRAHQ
jgi:type III pantothenate kinase